MVFAAKRIFLVLCKVVNSIYTESIKFFWKDHPLRFDVYLVVNFSNFFCAQKTLTVSQFLNIFVGFCLICGRKKRSLSEQVKHRMLVGCVSSFPTISQWNHGLFKVAIWIFFWRLQGKWLHSKQKSQIILWNKRCKGFPAFLNDFEVFTPFRSNCCPKNENCKVLISF